MLPDSFEFQFDNPTGLREPVPSYPWQWRYLGKFMFGFDMIRYAVSKAAIVLFTKELQARLNAQGHSIICVAVHPGEATTEGLLAINNRVVKTIARMSFLTAEQTTATPLFATTAEEVRQNAKLYEESFLVPIGKLATPNQVADNDRQVKGLWAVTTAELDRQLVAENLPVLQPW